MHALQHAKRQNIRTWFLMDRLFSFHRCHAISTIFRAAGPPSKPEDYHRINTFLTSLDKVLAEIENRFSGNEQDVLYALGNATPRQ